MTYDTATKLKLWTDYKAGKPGADEAVVDHYRKLVRHLALRMTQNRDFLEDLCQCGDMAVLDAHRRYQPTAGTSLYTWVVRVVKTYIRRYWSQNRSPLFRLPREATYLDAKIEKYRTRYGEGTEEQIAAHLGISVQQYQRYLALQAHARMRAAPAFDVRNDGPTRIDLQGHCQYATAGVEEMSSPDTGIATDEERLTVKLAIERLEERDQVVLKLFLRGYTDGEIAEKIGSKENYVWKIRTRATLRLRAACM